MGGKHCECSLLIFLKNKSKYLNVMAFLRSQGLVQFGKSNGGENVKNFLKFSLWFLPLSAFANENDRVTEILNQLLNLISGVWGMSLCSLAIAGTGFACFVMGTVPVSRVVAVTIGSACVVGAPRLIHLFGIQ